MPIRWCRVWRRITSTRHRTTDPVPIFTNRVIVTTPLPPVVDHSFQVWLRSLSLRLVFFRSYFFSIEMTNNYWIHNDPWWLGTRHVLTNETLVRGVGVGRCRSTLAGVGSLDRGSRLSVAPSMMMMFQSDDDYLSSVESLPVSIMTSPSAVPQRQRSNAPPPPCTYLLHPTNWDHLHFSLTHPFTSPELLDTQLFGSSFCICWLAFLHPICIIPTPISSF